MFRYTSPGHGFSVIFCNYSLNSYKILAYFFILYGGFYDTQHNSYSTQNQYIEKIL